jgi:putative oxidoreductase
MVSNLFPLLGAMGRVLLASIFILSGPGKIFNASATAAFMSTGGLPNWPTLAVLVGILEVVAGLALAVGTFTRGSALALSAFTVLATLAFHAYWSAPIDQQLVQQLMFSKNIAIAGALLFVAANGAGAWSLDARRTPGIPAFGTRSAW